MTRTLRGQKKKPLWGTCIGVYAGQYFDGESGLHYNYYRYYDPRLGRYLRTDPYRGDLSEPETLNPYIYALSNPIISIDPEGLCPKICIPVGGKFDTRKIFSEQKTWLTSPVVGDPLCRYRTDQRDYMESIIKINWLCFYWREENCECVFDKIDTYEEKIHLEYFWTGWNTVDRFDAQPLSRLPSSLGVRYKCPPKGPNYQGPTPSFHY